MSKQRRCHAIKANKGTEAPSSWVFFDTETWPDGSDPDGKVIRHKLRLGVAYALRIESGRRVREQWCQFTCADQFWQFVWSRLSDHRPTWLVAHNLGFDFPMVDGFKLLTTYGLDSWKLVLGPPTTIMRGKPDGKSLNIVDGCNWFRTSISALGQWLSSPKSPMPPFTAADEDWYAYCKQDVSILASAVLHLIGLHRTHDLGVLGRTTAQCAMHSWRHRFSPVKPLLHDDDNVSWLERAAYYGGRVECNYVGERWADVYQLDVNSLYPSIMRDTPLPTKLVGHYVRPPVPWLASRLELYDGIARVTLDTQQHTYPLRPPDPRRSPWLTPKQLSQLPEEAWYGRTLYPRGVYATYLAGEELRAALRRGHILSCERVALYDRAVLFKEYVDWWYDYRLQSRAAGDGLGEHLSKAYLNSMAGIWAKHAPAYVQAADQIPPHPWARWRCKDLIADKVRVFRAVGNVTQEETDDGEAFDAFPAISACINAAARERLRELQATAGPHHWLYEDTDSLMVDQRGFDALCLAGYTSQTRLGALRLEAVADYVAIRGVKDYTFASRTVLKGARPDAEWADANNAKQWEWHGLRWALCHRGQPHAFQTLRELNFHRRYLKGRVGADGWTTPYDLFLDLF